MVNRLYTAVEGEGTTIGQPKWFLRFQGCSVGCKWCDSKETWKFKGFEIADFETEQHSMFKLVENDFDAFAKHLRNEAPNIHHISITGGEPLQQNLDLLEKLVEKLHRHNFVLQIETSGQTTPTSQTKRILDAIGMNNGLVSVDFKTPSSGIDANMDMIVQALKTARSHGRIPVQLKAVVSNETDYQVAKKAYNELMPIYSRIEYLITPCWPPGKEMQLGPAWFKMFIQDDEWYSMPKVIMQQHKTIFGTRDLDS